MQSPAPAATGEERRPAAILAIYSWDLVLALLALLGALAAFGGQAIVGTRTVNVSLAEQILAAVESASFAGLLIILSTLLTRRQRWVRIAQVATLTTAIGLGAISLVVAAILPGQGLQPSALTAVLVLVVDAAAILLLTAPRVAGWYTLRDGHTPRYVSGTLIFWALSGLVLIVLQALR